MHFFKDSVITMVKSHRKRNIGKEEIYIFYISNDFDNEYVHIDNSYDKDDSDIDIHGNSIGDKGNFDSNIKTVRYRLLLLVIFRER